MTFGELIPYNVSVKLKMVSFKTPQKNLSVYRFVKAIQDKQDFVEGERRKLIEKFGVEKEKGTIVVPPENMKEFLDAFQEIISMEIEDDIPSPGLVESDFEDTNCFYPEDKSLWMNGAEIDSVLFLSNKLSKKEGN